MGRLKEKYWRDAANEYEKRLSRFGKFEEIELPDLPEPANSSPAVEAQICEKVKEELDGLRMFCEIGEGSIAVDETEDIDWINNWKQYFHQFYIDDLLVIPSWEEVKPEDQGKICLLYTSPSPRD